MHYESIEGWFCFPNIYNKFLEIKNPKVLELGCYLGRSTSYILEKAHMLNNYVDLTIVDTFLGSEEHSISGYRDQFENNIQPVIYANKVSIIEGFSVDVAKTLPDETFDAILIDAAHDYKNVIADILAWKPKVKSGGFLAGDDFDFPGVTQAVTEAIELFNWKDKIQITPRIPNQYNLPYAEGNNWLIQI